MDLPLINILQIFLGFASAILFSYVLISSKPISLEYRPFVKNVTLALFLFSLTEVGELFQAEVIDFPLSLVAWGILIIILFSKLWSILRTRSL